MLIRAQDIRGLRTAAPDYPETEALKALLAGLRSIRQPFFLSGAELDRIFRWKLRSQYARHKERLATNQELVYHAVTRATFTVCCRDIAYELEVRLGLLVALRGVAVPVVSAVLALADPGRYCVIDFRGWRAMHGGDKHSFSIGDYRKYRHDVAELASELGWPVQETDLAIWEYDRRRSQPWK
ncbi:MAG: hypothetical protein AB1486_05450 [Planctomycetota bacterium]